MLPVAMRMFNLSFELPRHVVTWLILLCFMSTPSSESVISVGKFEYIIQSHSWNWGGEGEAKNQRPGRYRGDDWGTIKILSERRSSE